MNTPDRVRAHTDASVNRRIDKETAAGVRRYTRKSIGQISRRIEELDREWDMERILETNASLLAFTGLMLGMIRDRKWLALPALVLPFLFQHAVQGWCPPVPIFRRMGVRTRKEIEREKYALKILRGDFDHIAPASRADVALRAMADI